MHIPLIDPARPFLRTVVLYEDFPAVARALQVCDHIQNHVGIDTPMRLNVWRIKALEEAETRTLAASASAVSDLVILSAAWQQGYAPDGLREWLQLWLSLSNGCEHALFAIVPSASVKRLHNWKGWPQPEISRHPVAFSVLAVDDIPLSQESSGPCAPPLSSQEALWRPGSSPEDCLH